MRVVIQSKNESISQKNTPPINATMITTIVVWIVS
jgi:hypothetical protein